MKQAFPSIVDVNFTVNMELLLDSVEEGSVAWKTIVRNFFPDLETAVANAEVELGKIVIADEESDVICEACGRNMVIKYRITSYNVCYTKLLRAENERYQFRSVNLLKD